MHDVLAVVGVQTLARLMFEDRGACPLGVQEQGVMLARHQEDATTESSNATDANDP